MTTEFKATKYYKDGTVFDAKSDNIEALQDALQKFEEMMTNVESKEDGNTQDEVVSEHLYFHCEYKRLPKDFLITLRLMKRKDCGDGIFRTVRVESSEITSRNFKDIAYIIKGKMEEVGVYSIEFDEPDDLLFHGLIDYL